MKIYLLRHGEADATHSPDPYSAPLTTTGERQAETLARQCQEWGIDFLCTSDMRRAQQTADAISALMPEVERWDLTELEDVTVDDLMGMPTAGQLRSTWTDEQRRLGHERTWVRVMGAWTRIQLYARAHDLQQVAIVSHDTVLALLLLNWLGLDWRSLDAVELVLAPGATAAVTLDDTGASRPRIEWLNRIP
jgi:broad specificity phosphatase PhoE